MLGLFVLQSRVLSGRRGALQSDRSIDRGRQLFCITWSFEQRKSLHATELMGETNDRGCIKSPFGTSIVPILCILYIHNHAEADLASKRFCDVFPLNVC